MSVRSSHSPQSTFCVCVCVEFHVCCRFWKLHLWYLLYLLYRPFPFSFISLFVMGWRRRCRQPLPLAVQPVCALSRSVWSLLWRAAMSSSSKIIKQHECFSSVHLHPTHQNSFLSFESNFHFEHKIAVLFFFCLFQWYSRSSNSSLSCAGRQVRWVPFDWWPTNKHENDFAKDNENVI